MNNGFKKFKKVPFFISILLLGLSIGVFVFIYKATGKNVKESVEIEQKAQDEEKHIAEVKFLERAFNNLSPEINEFNQHFIKSNEAVPFLNFIENLGPKVGASVNVSQVELPKDNSYLNVSVSIDGSFASLYKFLLLLENSPYELDVVGMNISQKTEPTEENPISLWYGSFKVKLLSVIP